MSPALAGGFLTTGLPEKSRPAILKFQSIFLFLCRQRFVLTLYFCFFVVVVVFVFEGLDWGGTFNKTVGYEKVKLIFQRRQGF